MLDPHDVAYLAARGISASQAEQYGIRSATADELQTILDRAIRTDGLIFPYPGEPH